MRNFIISISTLFTLGQRVPAPGTVGTLVTLPFAYLLVLSGPLWHMLSILLLLPLAIVSAELYGQQRQSHDSPEVIIDEVLGYLIACLWLPLTWQTFVFSFLVFRLFDIFKPFPISVLDRKIKGGLGVVIDDVAAGLFTNIILQSLWTSTSILGSQSIVFPT